MVNGLAQSENQLAQSENQFAQSEKKFFYGATGGLFFSIFSRSKKWFIVTLRALEICQELIYDLKNVKKFNANVPLTESSVINDLCKYEI